MMPRLRTVLLGACVAALPLAAAIGGARAAEPSGVTLYDAASRPVATLVPVLVEPPLAQVASVDPMLSLIGEMDALMPNAGALLAQQQAIMRRMTAEMQAATRLATGGGLTEAAIRPDAVPPGGETQVVVTSFSSGRGSCSRTVRYAYPGDGGRPAAAVQQVGDACGALPGPGADSVPVALPTAPERTLRPQAAPRPRMAPDGTRLIRADYRRPIPTAPRTQHG